MKMKWIFITFGVLLSVSLFTVRSARAEALFGDIEAALITGDYNSILKMAEDLKPIAEGEALYELDYFTGMANLRLGFYPQAAEVFRKVTSGTESPRLHDKSALGLIDAYFLQEEFELAYKEGRDLVGARGASDYLSLMYFKLARASLKLAKWDEARTYLQQILNKYPHSFEAALAKQFLEEKQFFTVQVGSFMERARAQAMVDELKVRNEYAYIVELKDQTNETYYRVRVGQLARLQEARALKEKLDSLCYSTRIYP